MSSSRDPHDIVPDSFWQSHDSLADAVAAASSTDENDRKRCPADGCGSIQITPTSSKPINQTAHAWKCAWCGHTFDDPLPPKSENAGDDTEAGE